jgi:hypothetical protein
MKKTLFGLVAAIAIVGTFAVIQTADAQTPYRSATGNTASATAGAATLASQCGVITSESLSTAAGATYTLALTNTRVTTGTVAAVNLYNGTNTGGTLSIVSIAPTANTLTVIVKNTHATTAFNGTIKFSFCVLN